MTEKEWLTATDPTPMLEFLRGKASDRKLRLTGCGCARQHMQLHLAERLMMLVAIAELVADGLAEQARLIALLEELKNVLNGDATQDVHLGVSGIAFSVGHPPSLCRHFEQAFDWMAAGVAWSVTPLTVDDSEGWGNPSDPRWRAVWADELKQQIRITHDIFGNPFCPTTVCPSWLTSTVVALAEGIYQERAFDRLPILADALQDAGCDNDDMLNHCRSEGSHCRGCWVVDLLTGRK